MKNCIKCTDTQQLCFYHISAAELLVTSTNYMMKGAYFQSQCKLKNCLWHTFIGKVSLQSQSFASSLRQLTEGEQSVHFQFLFSFQPQDPYFYRDMSFYMFEPQHTVFCWFPIMFYNFTFAYLQVEQNT